VSCLQGTVFQQREGLNLIRPIFSSDSNRKNTLNESGSRSRNTRIKLATEVAVLPRVASGEPAAVAECLDRYKNLVWSLARRSCPDIETAEDAVQDIFLKLWKIADRYDATIASEPTFVAMIARRRLIDLSRKRSWKVEAEAELDTLTDEGMNASQRAELKDEAAKAAALLDQLPADQRHVIRLSVYEGLSHSKIAETTGLSLGTVKTHIRRGLLKLRRALFANDDAVPFSSVAQGELQ
jgi:RNA polymerase sigma factor (sigma-70 family)